MQLEIISVGKIKSPWIKEGIAHYAKLLSRSAEVKFTTVKETEILETEADLVRKQLNPRSLVVLLDAAGKTYDSVAFAKLIEKSKQTASTIQFVIGGAFGLSNSLKREFENHLSLSPLTFPHELTQVVLLEQLYRAFSIEAGTKYHK